MQNDAGQIVFQSANSSQVFSNAIGNCSVGSIVEIESGIYIVNTTWNMINAKNITVFLEWSYACSSK